MQKNKIMVALVAILVIAIGGYLLLKGKEVSQNLGATPTLDGVDNPNVRINGIQTYNYRQSIAATSSVVCTVRNPVGATSTLESYAFEVRTNGIAATQDLAVSTTTGVGGYGSSTPALMLYSAGTGQFSAEWQPNSATTTSTGSVNSVDSRLLPGMTNLGASNYIIGPSEYVSLRIATATPRTLDAYYTGSCSGVFRRVGAY